MYKDFNDYEILYMICDGNDFDIIYKKYQPLIYKVVKNYQGLFKDYGYELDDLMQIGYMTLYKAINLYNYNNSLFYTYFLKSLKKALLNEIRLNETNKRKILNESFSYDNLVPNTDISYIEIIPDKESCDFKENNRKFILFKNSLTFINSCIFELFYNGYSMEEIICILNKEKKDIIEGLKEIRKQKKVQSY